MGTQRLSACASRPVACPATDRTHTPPPKADSLSGRRVPLWPVDAEPWSLPGSLAGSTKPTHTTKRPPPTPRSQIYLLCSSLWKRNHRGCHLHAHCRSYLADEQTETQREVEPCRQVSGKAESTTGFPSFCCWGWMRKGLREYLQGSPTLSLCRNPFSKSHTHCVSHTLTPQIGQVLAAPLP